MEENTLSMFENWVVRKTFGLKVRDVRGDRHEFYSSSDFISVKMLTKRVGRPRCHAWDRT
jgi:hypothetical protein